MHIFFFIHNQFCHIAMMCHYTVFAVIPCEAKILSSHPTCSAVGMMAGSAHRRNNQVSWLQRLYLGANLDNFSQRFMPQHQVVRSGWRCAKFECTDFLVCAANSYLQY